MLLKLGRGYLVDRRRLLKGSYYAAFNAGEKLLFLFVCLFFGGVLGFEFSSSHLQKQAVYHLSHASSPFCSGYFGDVGLTNYFPRLASNSILPISVSQVSRITSVSYKCLENYCFSHDESNWFLYFIMYVIF
jgi:hypothetical protein